MSPFKGGLLVKGVKGGVLGESSAIRKFAQHEAHSSHTA
jgi:hypothetical protein